MRLWLKDSERRPDPVPLKTDDRKAILVGLVLWIIGLGVILGFFSSVMHGESRWLLWTCILGIALGLVGLIYTNRRHT